MGIADFGARSSRAFAVGFLRALDQTTIGGKLLHPREAVEIMDFIEQHEAENLTDTRHGLQQIQGVGVMVLGGFDNGELDVVQQLIVIADECKIDFDTFCTAGSAKRSATPSR